MEKRKVKMKGQELSVRGPRLNVGQQAPDFRLVDNEFNPKTLGDFGRQVKLVSIVPSLDTGVCDAQTRRFNEELSGLPGAVAITVSVDLPFAQKRWCGAAGLEQAVTLSDHYDVSFGEAYGVLIEELRLLARAVLVLDQDNIIRYTEYLEEISSHPDYAAALKAVKELL
ncbi:MAG: thiol peroxidase [Limnochordia bacterium]|jgi:thiol peroxidase|nr:thiol peroxidase [Limnochordia bacterium]MDI9463983.1 thiol peroxidase [Bacillota bacterium]NLO94609.1 thiol peroxidase [Bacillota bacterium]HOB40941.1 thiol peroxidase [Limnochordia bacterium]HOK32005.1 thiol peroxidase [Limnochordia bacterium]